MKYTVTLKQLRDAHACVSGYNKVVCMLKGVEYRDRDAYIRFSHKNPISLIDIANNNGITDAIWCLRITNDDRDNSLFAIWCIRQVQHLMTDERSLHGLDVAENFANGLATHEELAAAAAAARAAVAVAAASASWAADAAVSARAVAAAAWAVADATRAAVAADAARAAAAAVAVAARAAVVARAAAWPMAAAAAAAAAADAERVAQKEMFIRMCKGTAPWQVKGESGTHQQQSPDRNSKKANATPESFWARMVRRITT